MVGVGHDGLVSGRAPTGTYAGRTAVARRAERRARLVAAAREIWGDDGWGAVTMRGVCGRAGLVDRYFYESFADTDELLLAVWDAERDALVGAVVAAFVSGGDGSLPESLQAAISAVVERFRDEPVCARVVLGDHSGSTVLEARRRETVGTFIELLVQWVAPRLPDDTDLNALRMSTIMGVGGFAELIASWNARELGVDAERIAQHATSVASSLLGGYLPVA